MADTGITSMRITKGFRKKMEVVRLIIAEFIQAEQHVTLQYAIEWIIENPTKWSKLKNLYHQTLEELKDKLMLGKED